MTEISQEISEQVLTTDKLQSFPIVCFKEHVIYYDTVVTPPSLYMSASSLENQLRKLTKILDFRNMIWILSLYSTSILLAHLKEKKSCISE